MSILRNVRKSLIIVGILPIQEKNLPKNLRKYQTLINWVHIIFMISWLMCYLLSVLGFLFLRGKTFGEYSESGLFCVVTIMRFTLYIILVCQKSKLITVMDDLEKIIEKRKSLLSFSIKNHFLYN